ncbi:Ultraviolet N-glycosylase/AP lyase [Pirellulimonas nuda]|uniref:Ultraviolet N-glycosylase/AP lyase n=1 Tax=Pirellulimonas nuda TaxID=2528009 RepID=A0A518D6R7_9BACT|nr:endonuclease III domain-containing protein [Pirellulimonas nuda]QDU87151.1 Ultraviolet N-glycosylase/AP lyase [Pirellulimonas nuda]
MPIDQAYRRLLEAYGPQHWWPAQTPMEMIVGAVLVQHTAWRNVERAITQLQAAGLLEPGPLARAPQEELAQLIRVAGPHRVKARRLQCVAQFIVDRYGGSLDAMFADDPQTLRASLLGVHGIGPETADCIMNYGAGAPRFVVDAYARRVAGRHGWLDAKAPYAAVQQWFESRLPADAPLLGELHALIVKVGVEHCRPTPRCAGCPLECMLPGAGSHDDEPQSH